MSGSETCIILYNSWIFALIVSEPFFDAATLNLKYKNEVKDESMKVSDLLFPLGVSTDIESSSWVVVVVSSYALSFLVCVLLFLWMMIYHCHLPFSFYERVILVFVFVMGYVAAVVWFSVLSSLFTQRS